MSHSLPIVLRPRLDAKPWGGDRLARFGHVLPGAPEPLGEALLTHGDAVVASGPDEGRRLGDLAAAHPAVWCGSRGLAVTGGALVFPLLVKLIDARADLSLQLHPNDQIARAAGEPTGKTEAWRVLAAEPESVLYLGLVPGVDPARFAAAVRAGGRDAVAMVRAVPAVAGTTVFLPAGTVHALGAGVLLYELQQPSNTTYRLYDWDRRDASGQPRPVHLEQGLAALDPTGQPEAIPPVPLGEGRPARTALVACRRFALERIALARGETLALPPIDGPQVATAFGGAVIIRHVGGALRLGPGETAAIPAACAIAIACDAAAPAVVFRSWLPDLLAEIVVPARAAGAADATIARLAAPLDDIWAALAAGA
ncbi:MAG TPA: class I mannose-6-phosphate isomerase [Thermomicrobiales bacterium]|nr:class I mannose-6-phosphate isomerase [Thermomicrobiales bacterium]